MLHTQYLCQSHILLLNGILQTVAEGSGQQQICRFADHIVYLCGTEHTEKKQRQIAENQWRKRCDFPRFSKRVAASKAGIKWISLFEDLCILPWYELWGWQWNLNIVLSILCKILCKYCNCIVICCHFYSWTMSHVDITHSITRKLHL